MLDRATGNLRFEGLDLSIGPGLMRADFEKTKAAAGATVHAGSQGSRSWVLSRYRGVDADFDIVLFFDHERLREAHLINMDPQFGTCWMNYSEEKELARKGAHDGWLLSRCQVPPGRYPWGGVWSGILNTNSRAAAIVIRYDT